MTPRGGKTPEQLARENIDSMLEDAGWIIQDREEMNVAAAFGVAIREFKTDAGFADYLLYVDQRPAGVIEAKREGIALTGVEVQTRDYADRFPALIPAPVRPLPFLYESSGVDTRFTNLLDPIARSRPVFTFHQPETLGDWLDAAIAIQDELPEAPAAATFMGGMRQAPPLNTAGMWPAQIRAVNNLEDSLRNAKPKALIQMATGSGKTFTAISAAYRMIKYGRARRVLFLVDRGNLGRQALRDFKAYTTPDDGRKFTELYNVLNPRSNKIDPINKVVITTIQRVYSILSGDPDLDEDNEEGSAYVSDGGTLVREVPPLVYSPALPPDFFDVIFIDECHRSIYSVWQKVLYYFDASLIGLTATPSARTFAFFDKNVVSEYRHEHAVRDKVNVPFEVYTIRTRITEQGSTLIAEDKPSVGHRDRQTRAVRWGTIDEDVTYNAPALDRSVVARDQIRTVVREFKDKLFTEIFPGRTVIPKTLIFAKSDSHAEDILEIVREEFALSNEEAVKITYKPERGSDSPRKQSKKKAKKVSASRRPEALIKAFRTSPRVRIAVTVDMIATGTDIKPLECVMFMRSVKSKGLFEQMKGRGVRVIPDTDYQVVTPGGGQKTHFVIVDAVEVMHEHKTDPPIIRDRGISFEKLLEVVSAGNRDEAMLSTLAGRLYRMERKLDDAQKTAIERASKGVSLQQMVGDLLDAIDPDKEDQAAREAYKLGPDQEPSAAQLRATQKRLRDTAAQTLAHNPALRQTILEVRKQQEVLIDNASVDAVTFSGVVPENQPDYERKLVDSFQAYIDENRDEIDALQILYARPPGKRLTRAQIKELADAIQSPPRQWTTQALWDAYAKVEAGKVGGASQARLWTDIVALARHALHPGEELVPFADQVHARFDNWVAQQATQGRTFDTEQMRWLEMIRDQIAGDVEVGVDDLDQVPFVNEGGLGRFYEVFGDHYEQVVVELNTELVA